MALPAYTVRSDDRVAHVYPPFGVNEGLCPGYWIVVAEYPQDDGTVVRRWTCCSDLDDENQQVGAKQVARRFVADKQYALRRRNAPKIAEKGEKVARSLVLAGVGR
jgi:hypothetical protein